MKKLINYMPIIILILGFNLFCMGTVNEANHLAPRVVYWVCGFITSFIIVNEIYEYRFNKMKSWYRNKYPKKF